MYGFKHCAFAGFAISISAGAALAAATQVNIVDPTIPARVARVDAGNRLAVQEVPPVSYFHTAHASLTPANGCVVIAQAPSGKALIARQVRVNTWMIGTSGGGAKIYANSNCDSAGLIGTVTPAALGLATVGFDPGLAVPAGGAFSFQLFSIDADAYFDGYAVAASVAPAAGGTTQLDGTSH